MRIAITGGTGFIGRHLAQSLAFDGHEPVLLARKKDPWHEREASRTTFVATDLSDVSLLTDAFAGCNAIAHCAGINREIATQTYRKVHIEGTQNVVVAAQKAKIKKVVIMSFLGARPNCDSAYHESKWAAEEMVRNCGIDFTIVKAGIVYGYGDHMLDHLSHALYTFPIFAMVGFKEKGIRPLAIEVLTRVLCAALVERRISGKTVAVTGAEELYLSEAVRRVARVTGNRIFMVNMPVAFHYLFARFWEWSMKTPLVARAQVRILSEGVIEPAVPCDQLPYDLFQPTRSPMIRSARAFPGLDLSLCTT